MEQLARDHGARRLRPPQPPQPPPGLRALCDGLGASAPAEL
eukprot:gene56149-12570_t